MTDSEVFAKTQRTINFKNILFFLYQLKLLHLQYPNFFKFPAHQTSLIA